MENKNDDSFLEIARIIKSEKDQALGIFEKHDFESGLGSRMKQENKPGGTYLVRQRKALLAVALLMIFSVAIAWFFIYKVGRPSINAPKHVFLDFLEHSSNLTRVAKGDVLGPTDSYHLSASGRKLVRSFESIIVNLHAQNLSPRERETAVPTVKSSRNLNRDYGADFDDGRNRRDPALSFQMVLSRYRKKLEEI